MIPEKMSPNPLQDHGPSNRALIAAHRPGLHRCLANHSPAPIAQLEATRTVPTYHLTDRAGVKVWGHHPEDPWRDVGPPLTDIPVAADNDMCVFVGMGLGYLPLWLIRQRPRIKRIYILEPSLDLLCLALAAVDLKELILSDKVVWLAGEKAGDAFKARIGAETGAGPVHLIYHQPGFKWAPEQYEALKTRVFEAANAQQIAARTLHENGPAVFHNRFENLALWPYAFLVEELSGAFAGRPAVLVTPGPSLSQALPRLQQARADCLVIAADAALAPLLNAGICPDFVTSIDFRDLNFEKFVPFLDRAWPTALVTTVTATPLIPNRFAAAQVYLAFQQNDSQTWLHDLLDPRAMLPPASSVIHLSLALAQLTGADPIVFVGHDLAHTGQRRDHADGVVTARCATITDHFETPAIGGGNVATSRAYHEFKIRLEEMMRAHPRRYINTLAAGAHIEGTEVLPFEQIAATWFNEPVKPLVTKVMRTVARPPLKRFVDACAEARRQVRETVNRVDRLEVRLMHVRACWSQQKSAGIKRLADLDADLRNAFDLLETGRQRLSADSPVWHWTQELAATRLTENAKFTAAVKSAPDFTTRFDAHLAQIAYVTGAQRDMLTTFQNHLAHLTARLDRARQTPAAATGRNIRADATFYLEAGAVLQAEKLLKLLLETNGADAWARQMMGTVQAQRLQLDAARTAWQKAVECDPAVKPVIAGIRLALGRYWLEQAVRDPVSGLADQWLRRCVELTGDHPKLTDVLTTAWTAVASVIEAHIADRSFKNARRMLDTWSFVSDKVPAWARLRAKWDVAHKAFLAQLGGRKRQV